MGGCGGGEGEEGGEDEEADGVHLFVGCGDLF